MWTWLRALRDRLRGVTRRDVVVDEIREEIQFHLDRRVEEHERRGLDPAAARHAARRRFGNPSAIADRGYDVRGGGLMESVIQDVKYAVRLLVKQRGYSVVALATLTLGIGATTAIFCITDAALIRPLPYDKPEQLVRIDLTRPERPAMRQAGSLDDMDRLRALSHVFSHVGVDRGESMVVVSGSEPERITIDRVTTDYLPLYGKTPLLGRAFTNDDELLGAPPVVLLGYRYWRTTFQGDPNVVGRTLQFSNDSATIVGVLRDDEARAQVKITMPLQATSERRAARQYAVRARIRDQVTLAQAQREVDALAARLGTERPDYKGYGFLLTPEYNDATRASRTTVNILLGAVGFVLLIACINVASLQLARGATRQTELAIRASIGAGRGRLIRQLVTESIVLSVAGSALGALVAWLALDTLVANVPVRISSEVTVGLNWRVLGATAALAAVCGAAFGLIPALRTSRVDVNTVLGRGSRSIRTTLSKAAGGLLVSLEIAAAILLATGAALMVRSFARVNQFALGFDPYRFVTLEVAPIDDRPDVFGPYYGALLDRIRHLPGVASAGGTDNLPLSGNMSFSRVFTSRGPGGAVVQQITPGYLNSIGVQLRAGRFPAGADVNDPSWVVLDERAAAQLFPDQPALGQQVKYGDVWREVIGVVARVESNGVDRPPAINDGQIYVSYTPGRGGLALNGRPSGQPMVIVVMPADPNAPVASALSEAAKAIGPKVIVRRVREGRAWWSDNIVTPRQRTVLLSILAGLGLLLALVGVFGVTSFAVGRRVPEIGLRMAFGARPGQVVRSVLKDAMLPISLGVTAGLAGAWFVTKVISTFLYKTEPRDPAAFAAAAVVLAVCGLVAAWLPARRAASIDPVAALRSE